MGIHINGGTVIAAGHMLDSIEEGGQTYAVFSFAQKQDGKEELILKNQEEKAVLTHKAENAYSILVYSSPDLAEGTYTLWKGETQLSGQTGGVGGFGMPGGMPGGFPGGMTNGEMPENMPEGMENGEMPEGFQGGMINGEMPEGFPGGMTNGEMPEGFPEGMDPENIPEGMTNGQRPEISEGQMPGRPDGNWQNMPQGGKNPFEGGTMEEAELSKEFVIKNGANMFSNIS